MMSQRVFLAITLVALAFLAVPAPAENSDRTKAIFKNYSVFLNDVSARRSRIVYVPYPNSPRRGLQHGLVHTSDGSVAFARVDMVVDATMPIVLKRVYLSTRSNTSGFGDARWQFSIQETIEQAGNGQILYRYGNGRELLLNGNREFIPQPFDLATSDILRIRVRQNAATVVTRTGLSKRFRRVGSTYLITLVADQFGNQIEIDYDSENRITRVASSDGPYVDVSTNSSGYYESITDDQGRTVQFRYDGNHLNEVDDISG